MTLPPVSLDTPDQARPDGWNESHEAALAFLTDEWRDVTEIPHRKVALDDLVVAKVADVDQMHTFTRGIASGSLVFYRRGTGMRVVREVRYE